MKYLVTFLTSFLIFGASSANALDNEPWQFSVTPFFWAVNINGDIEVGVAAEGIENQLLHISENFLGIARHVHSGGMLDINVTKGKFGIFAGVMYVSIKNINVATSDDFEVRVNSKFSLLSGGVFYRGFEYFINPQSKISLGPYAGARYTKNESGAVLNEAPEYGASYDAYWTEPFVGATLQYNINKQWAINLAADIGIFKKNQDSYNIIGLLDYKPFEHWAFCFGYRELYQSFTEGSGSDFFEWKMHVGGPILGVSFIF